MLRDNIINFLEVTIVLLGLTNLFSIVIAAYALTLARGLDGTTSAAPARYGSHPPLARWLRMNRWTDGVQR